MKLKCLFFGMMLFCMTGLFAQYGTGAQFSKTKAPFEKGANRGYSGQLPTSASLKMFTPYAKNQGQYGTCTAWSMLYGALTTQYAKQQNITDRNIITGLSFCPFFIYNQVNEDNSCQSGMGTVDALLFMMDNGVKRFYLPALGCGSLIDDAMKTDASNYKIKDAFILHQMPNSLPCDFTDYLAGITCYYENKPKINVDDFKSYLADGMPIEFAMFVPNSFFAAKTDYWQSTEAEHRDPAMAIGAHEGLHQQHALAIVGYDDKKYGGAFEIMNSWGGAWGDNGFVWIKYDELFYWMYEAYAMELFDTPVARTASGCISGDCNNGYGVFAFADGGRYEGHFKNGSYNGNGIYTWKDGNVYAGEWLNGERNGSGIQYFPDGTNGYCVFDHDKQVGGYATWNYDGGDVYYGNIIKGTMTREGFGTYRFASGQSYSGGWKNNNQQGLGMYKWTDGSYYLGEYSTGSRDGIGIYVNSDGTVKAGKWSLDAFKSGHDGLGYAENSVVGKRTTLNELPPRNYATADCKDGDCLVGDGKRAYSDGSHYAGEFKDGVEDGYGTMTYADGSKYTGHWKQGSPDGAGRFEYPNGANVIVNYEDGKITGYVLQYDAAGNFLVQYYENNVYVRDVTPSLTLDAYAKKPVQEFQSNPEYSKKADRPIKK